MASFSHSYRFWNRSWLTWLLTNAFGISGTLLYASLNSESLGYPAILSGVATVGSLLLLPLIWFVLARALASRRQGRRLLAFWGATLLTYVGIGLLVSGLGGFFGIIALVTCWPYLPAAFLGTTLAYRKWLFRGNDGRAS